MKSIIGLASIVFLLSNCARAPLKNKIEALRITKPIEVRDTLPAQTLIQALKQNISHLQEKGPENFQCGQYSVKKDQMLSAQKDLLAYLEKNSNAKISEYIQNHFDFLEVYGQDSWGQVFVTSYFDPVINGSRHPTKTLAQPIYRVPQDLVSIQLDQFIQKFPNLALNPKDEQKSNGSVLRGRLVKTGPEDVPIVVPYFDRKEIDQDQNLKGKKLEMVWVDPIDSFFLQIQGSGKIILPDKKELRVGYGAQNGYRYEALGKFLKDKIPLEEMTMQRIEEYLKTLTKEELQNILNQNPSYVFFKELKSKSVTYLGTEVVGGRGIATDFRYFPKGVLAYLDVETPTLDESGKPIGHQPTPRLVIDQDTGGAIRGGGRVDLYWGEGAEAKKYAGAMKQSGRLYYLVPKGVAR